MKKLIFLFLSFPLISLSYSIQQSLLSFDSYAYIDQFCYASSGISTLSYELTFPQYQTLSLLLYFIPTMNYEDWKIFWNLKESEEYKYQRANYRTLLNNGMNGTAVMMTVDGNLEFQWKENMWMFIALTTYDENCTIDYCSSPLEIYQSTFTMQNSDQIFNPDLSLSANYEQQVVIYGAAMQSLLLILALRVYRLLAQFNKSHTIVTILLTSVILHWLGLIAQLAYFTKFQDSINGQNISADIVGRYLSMTGELLLMLHLILLAKGWAIVRRKISSPGVVKLAVYATVYFCTQWSLLLWIGIDPSLSLAASPYESTAGVFFLTSRMFGAFWFYYACQVTIRMFQRKLRFYVKFLVCGVLWFILLPVAALVSHYLPAHCQPAFMRGSSIIIVQMAQFILVVLFSPLWSLTKSFPFHQSPYATVAKHVEEQQTCVLPKSTKNILETARDETFPGKRVTKAVPLLAIKRIERSIERNVSELINYSEELQVAFNDLADSDIDEDLDDSEQKTQTTIHRRVSSQKDSPAKRSSKHKDARYSVEAASKASTRT